MRHSVSIALDDRSYSIEIGAGLLSDHATFANLPQASVAVVVSNATVAPLYAQRLQHT